MELLLAHGGRTGIEGLLSAAWIEWTWEPLTVALLIASAIVYARGVRVLWRRIGKGGGIRWWEAGAFALGLLSLAAALLSPVSWLSGVLFSMHMTQHEILMLVSAPLLVFGRRLLAFLWAFSSSARERIASWIRRPSLARTWRRLTSPAAAFVLHGLALWIWHVPTLYEAALASEAVQHVSFVATAVLFWWGMVHGRYGRIGYGVGVLYVFLTAVHSSILGALLAISPRVWYRTHASAAADWRLDPLEDQQLAGLLMWVPSGVIFIVFGLALFAAWLGESERRVRLGSVPHA